MENIIYYISHNLNNKKAALTLTDELIQGTRSICDFPYGVSEYVPIKKLNHTYRRIQVRNFYMFYTINEETKIITIARVLYRKRDIDHLLK